MRIEPLKPINSNSTYRNPNDTTHTIDANHQFQIEQKPLTMALKMICLEDISFLSEKSIWEWWELASKIPSIDHVQQIAAATTQRQPEKIEMYHSSDGFDTCKYIDLWNNPLPKKFWSFI